MLHINASFWSNWSNSDQDSVLYFLYQSIFNPYIKYNLVGLKSTLPESAVSTQWDQTVNQGPMEREDKEGPESMEECWGRADRGAVLVLKQSVCCWTWGVWSVLVTFCLCHPESLVPSLSLPISIPEILPEVPISVAPLAVVCEHISIPNSHPIISHFSTMTIIKSSVKPNKNLSRIFHTKKKTF